MKAARPPIAMKHPKPIVPRTLVALFSGCLLFIVLYFALMSLLEIDSLYGHLDDEVLQQQNAAVLEYLQSPLGAPNNLVFLTSDEQQHMSDVKRLFDIAFVVYLACLGVLLGVIGVFAYFKMWNRFDEMLSRSLRAAGWTILGACLVIGMAALLNFQRLWFLLHGILFPQGNWMFPTDSVLITLYPAGFFQQAVIWWTAMVLSFGVVAIMISYVMEHLRRHEAHFTQDFEKRKRSTK